VSKKRDCRPTKAQWAAITTATTGMAFAAGPVGAVLTGAGAIAGSVGANWMGWSNNEDADRPSDD
jgi:hypothetical protein